MIILIKFWNLASLVGVYLLMTPGSNAMPNSEKGNDYRLELSNSIPLFDETSITKEYLNFHTGLKWNNILGDWIDKTKTPQGNVPWASVNVNSTSEGPIEIDVKTLALKQRGKKNQLMILSATVPVKISSREGIRSPKLVITLINGDSLEVLPLLDNFVSLSDNKNFNTKILRFDSINAKAFIQFDIPKKEFKSVKLQLWPIKILGFGQIQVFNLAPKSGLFHFKENGLAQGTTSYASLKKHPDVVFVDTFDSSKIKPEWFWQTKIRRGQVENGYLSGEIDPKRKNNSAFNLRYYFSKHLNKEPMEIYFRYSIRFHNDFIFSTEGGKLPGQAGTYNTCGWGGRKPGLNCLGWSARMHWLKPIKVGPYKDLIPIGTYLYHLDQKTKYGDGEKWQAYCSMDEWCELEQYVKLNTPGANDGILRGYHEGKLVYERQDIRYRNNDSVRIEDIWMLIYHGGTGYPIKPIHADIDNVVISRRYIGLIDKNQSPEEKSTFIKEPLGGKDH